MNRTTGPTSSRRVMVIGVGNALRGDDAAGLLAARRVREDCAEAEVVEHDGDGAALMELWRGREAVIVIDAASSGRAAVSAQSPEPGTVHRFDAARQPVPSDVFHYSTHAFGVAEAVELARSLGGLPARMLVYGIEGADYRAGAPVTPAVAAAIARTAEQVVEEVRGFSG